MVMYVELNKTAEELRWRIADLEHSL